MLCQMGLGEIGRAYHFVFCGKEFVGFREQIEAEVARVGTVIGVWLCNDWRKRLEAQ